MARRRSWLQPSQPIRRDSTEPKRKRSPQNERNHSCRNGTPGIDVKAYLFADMHSVTENTGGAPGQVVDRIMPTDGARPRDSMNRKRVPTEIETAVLMQSARRCTLCFRLFHDLNEKRGQIAHPLEKTYAWVLDGAGFGGRCHPFASLGKGWETGMCEGKRNGVPGWEG